MARAGSHHSTARRHCRARMTMAVAIAAHRAEQAGSSSDASSEPGTLDRPSAHSGPAPVHRTWNPGGCRGRCISTRSTPPSNSAVTRTSPAAARRTGTPGPKTRSTRPEFTEQHGGRKGIRSLHLHPSRNPGRPCFEQVFRPLGEAGLSGRWSRLDTQAISRPGPCRPGRGRRTRQKAPASQRLLHALRNDAVQSAHLPITDRAPAVASARDSAGLGF